MNDHTVNIFLTHPSKGDRTVWNRDERWREKTTADLEGQDVKMDIKQYHWIHNLLKDVC